MTEATSRTSIELQQKTDFDEVKEMIYEFARTSIELQLQMKMNSSSNDPHFYRAAASSVLAFFRMFFTRTSIELQLLAQIQLRGVFK